MITTLAITFSIALLPLLAFVGIHLDWAFSLALFVALTASLQPGFERICNLPPFRLTRFKRGQTALTLVIVWTSIATLIAFTAGPLTIQGAIDGVSSTTVFVGSLPDRYKQLGNESFDWLQKFGVTKQMIDMVTDYLREHTKDLQDYLSTLINPSKEAARWIGGFLFRGTVNVLIAAVIPYFMIAFWYLWPQQCRAAGGMVRSFLPHREASYLIRWWELFTCLGSKLMLVLGWSMLIFTGFYLILFLIVLPMLGYYMSPPRAMFNAAILGITSAIPVIGGLINYMTIAVVSFIHFGLDWWILSILFAIVLLAHLFESNVVTQLLLGKHLESSLLGVTTAFYVGLACWGATLNGIGMFLFLPVFWNSLRTLIDEMRAERPVFRFVPRESIYNRPTRMLRK